MKTKKFLFGILAVAIVFFVSCSSKSEKTESESQSDAIEESTTEAVVEEIVKKSYQLGGAVYKYPITMNIDIEGSQVKGTYYYNKRGPNAKLYLSGVYENGEMDLNEIDEKGVPTGHFKGTFEDGEFKGQFIDNKGKVLDFLATESGASVAEVLSAFEEGELPDDFDSQPDYGDEDGDPRFDKFLDDYAKFMDEYVKCINKMAKNDPTAIANYAKMMAKYAQITEEADRIKGSMSISQLEKFNSITAKITDAMQSVKQ